MGIAMDTDHDLEKPKVSLHQLLSMEVIDIFRCGGLTFHNHEDRFIFRGVSA